MSDHGDEWETGGGTTGAGKPDRFGTVISAGTIQPVNVEDLNPNLMSNSVARTPEYVPSHAERFPAPVSEDLTPPDAGPWKTDVVADPEPEPVTFFAADRYHAMTYVRDHLLDVADALKSKLHAALTGMTHQGPVSVSIPAPRPALSVQEAPEGTPVDANPAEPDDGAFAIKPVRYVAV
jgi:hypothetical protein